MGDTIKFKRGTKAGIPTLVDGEPAYVSDENAVYLGTSSGNKKIVDGNLIAIIGTEALSTVSQTLKGAITEVNDAAGAGVSGEVLAQINIQMLDVRSFGCKCDANTYDAPSKKWYTDSSKTVLATDDTAALQTAINTCVTSTWLKIPKNICLNTAVRLRQGIHIVGNSTHSYGWDFNETVVVTNATTLDRFFYYNGDGITDSWHHATFSFLRLDGDNKVAIGLDVPGAGECSEIHHISAFRFTNAAIRISGECAPCLINNVSLNFNNYGLLCEGARHTMTLTGISGDANVNLIRFKSCMISLGCTITGIKAEFTITPVVFENCNGGNYTFVGGSSYPVDGSSTTFIQILGFSVNKNSIIILGTNCTGTPNLIEDNSASGRTIVNLNGQNGIITYCNKLQIISPETGGDGGLCVDRGILFRKYDGTFVNGISSTSDGGMNVYAQTGSGGLSLRDSANVKCLQVGKGSAHTIDLLRGHTIPVKKVTASMEFNNLDNVIVADATSGSMTVKGFLAGFTVGFEVIVKKTDASANTVTISMNKAETIEGVATMVLSTKGESAHLIFDGGTNWVSV